LPGIDLPVFRLVCSSVFSLLILFYFRSVYRINGGIVRPKPGLNRVHGLIPVVLFIALLSYQARWQMFGFLDPEFLRVQRGFDTRGDLVGCRFHRGAILDATGVPLASDETDGSRLTRHYPLGPSALHLVGYHDAIFGSTSLEKCLDSQLMGRRIDGVKDFFRLLSNSFVHRTLRGNPVRLTIHGILQQKAYELLEGRKGAIVAVDPRNGAVLTMVSSPGFDPNNLTPERFRRLRNQSDFPFMNRSTHGRYPPGSTFKSLVALKALELDLHPEYRCGPEGFECGHGQPAVHDYQYYAMQEKDELFPGHGMLNLDRALVLSCNVFFAKLGVSLGSDRLREVACQAGFDQVISPAGPGLPSLAGHVPLEPDLPVARMARFAIGQDELLTTPLHLALTAAALGSHGIIYRPKYLLEQEPVMWKPLTTIRTATETARKMIQVVEFGTGQKARIPGIIVGGKTGTAENTSGTSHALFIGFAPWPGPTIALAVVIEQGGAGGREAAPIAAQLFSKAEEIGLFDVFREEPL
jgi:penicillin-binding protein A